MFASPAAVSHASSIAFQTIGFGRAVTLSTRVVKAKVTGLSEVKVDGGTFHSVDVTVEAVLKGAPAKPGERIRVFNGAEWFQHTHAAAIKGGVVSYADPHYATPLPAAELKPGAVAIVFLRGEAPPPGFPFYDERRRSVLCAGLRLRWAANAGGESSLRL